MYVRDREYDEAATARHVHETEFLPHLSPDITRYAGQRTRTSHHQGLVGGRWFAVVVVIVIVIVVIVVGGGGGRWFAVVVVGGGGVAAGAIR